MKGQKGAAERGVNDAADAHLGIGGGGIAEINVSDLGAQGARQLCHSGLLRHCLEARRSVGDASKSCGREAPQSVSFFAFSRQTGADCTSPLSLLACHVEVGEPFGPSVPIPSA